MTEKEIKKLMDKYLEGTITTEEEMLLEQFDGILITGRKMVFRDAAHRRQVRERLQRKIQWQRRERSLRHTAIWKAAVALLVVFLGIRIWYQQADVKNEAEPVMVEKSTDWGQKLNLTLSDGTEVRLNSGSTIRFPKDFTAPLRRVELSGEAFFNVAKDTESPFVISSGEVETTVLGTSFNMSTFPGEKQVVVTVATGKVKVASAGNEMYLDPYEQGVYDRDSGTFSKDTVDPDSFLLWKDGIIRFDDATMEEVASRLERWYGVRFIFENRALKECHLTATYDNQLLAVVLESIRYAKKGIRFEYGEDHKILIKGTCAE
ncbi:FecR family protein [Sinomicrobium soli]|uniref:FecR family protein n=1 Tax=Sinomicrobium sp. N-1-3-6 TaxID=2219864 RepID=UPI000DCB2D20|nr:FecR domain-containing protein [Sinomicrobium sp. N-1-3-6]RAV30001.1 hypothetical protein DN748_04130 [Sinomicrobium sp. N-1-3-6]